MAGDRFELDGYTYYQQTRKCGKPTCRCAAGREHGPYWYRRNQHDNRVEYIGRELPPAVTETLTAYANLLPMMAQEHERLLSQADALARLMGHRRLSEMDRAALHEMGFGACLV